MASTPPTAHASTAHAGDASPPALDVRLHPGDVVGGRYAIVRLVGAGGMGAVFEGKHVALGKPVGIKVMRPEVARDERLAARFVQEARAAADVRHRNIVEMLDYGIDGDRPYIVMEYLDGEPLSKRLAREGRLSVGALLDVVDPVLRALAVAHARGIVHRDIKPENVFLAKGDEPGEIVPKILDFGVARRDGAEGDDVRLTGTNVTLGTPAYMAPEQAMSAREAGQAADQYAIGVLLYEGVCARLPHQVDSYNGMIVAKVTTDPTPIREVRPDLPEAFAKVVMRALARKPGDRFASVGELREALAPFRDDRTTPAPAPAVIPPTVVRTDVDSAAPTVAATPAPLPATVRDAPAAPAPNATAPGWSVDRAPPARSRRGIGFLGVAGAVVCVGIVALAWYARGREAAIRASTAITVTAPSRAPTLVHWRIHATPNAATIRIDGEFVGSGNADIQRPADDRPHTIQLSADGYEGVTEQRAGSADLEIERTLVAIAPASAVDASVAPLPAPPVAPTHAVAHGHPPPPVHSPVVHDPNHHIFRPAP